MYGKADPQAEVTACGVTSIRIQGRMELHGDTRGMPRWAVRGQGGLEEGYWADSQKRGSRFRKG